MYGSQTNEKGELITERSGGNYPMVGLAVEGNELMYFGNDKDANGENISGVAKIEFKQTNGSTFQHKWWDPTDEDETLKNKKIHELTDTFRHIFSKVVTEQEFFDAVAGSRTFDEMIYNIQTKIFPKSKGMKFTLKIIYKKRSNDKYYASFPKFPAYVENAAITTVPGSTFKYNKDYDLFEMPKPTVMDEPSNAPAPSVADDLPF